MYDCLKGEYGIKQEDLILYGQSVGSGPTLHLAARLQKLRGVVLHSAILSGIRVLYPVKMTLWFDIFKVGFHWFFFLMSLNAWLYNLVYVEEVGNSSAEHWQNTTSKLSCSCYTCKFPMYFSIIDYFSILAIKNQILVIMIPMLFWFLYVLSLFGKVW